MQPTDSAQERKRKQNHQLNRQYMKRVDADITRHHLSRTVLFLVIFAVLAFVVLAPAGLQIHHLVFHHLIPAIAR